MARIITVTSGKGGVGKTSISLNLALELASSGHRVCLFDADLGLANINILTGIYPDENLESVINGRKSLQEIIVRDYQGIDLIPGSTGVEMIANLSGRQAETLIEAFRDLDFYDYFIFDTSAGISSQVLSFCMASHEMLLIVTEEPTSLTDAYSLLKVLSAKGFKKEVRVVVNQVRKKKAAQAVFKQLKDTVQRFINIDLIPLGLVANDNHVQMSVVTQVPFSILFPDSPGSRCIRFIARKLSEASNPKQSLSIESFWDSCLSHISNESNDFPEGTGEVIPKKNPEISAYELLQEIEVKVASLMEDLSQVKKLLADEKKEPRNAPTIQETPPEKPGFITLDFEEWMDSKQSRQKEHLKN